ncbi:MAG TPA: hypothetical protein PLO33_05825 [Kouleothrix sp.]|uniref:hypothetical protein n=1 Tax=Kouleothrix sp. TaxID=2779161 RepID=UPI002BD7E84C|nr:hypothetical protein [Kouleothrix sp.]HRC75176.1 hypothetical protein [Kouleothrix sp.]
MTAAPSLRELTQLAQQAGYEVIAASQLRPNRWLLTLGAGAGAPMLALVQARRLVTAADVQDLAELVRLRRVARGLLLAYGGSFSPAAQRTLAELSDNRLVLCTTLPLAPTSDVPRQGALWQPVP